MAGDNSALSEFTSLDVSDPLWEHFYTVAPLVVIGSKEKDSYNLAPKHMAMPLGHDNFYCFVCTPEHSTYHNISEYGEFTVSYPKPDELIYTSLSASPRCDEDSNHKNIINELKTIKSKSIDALFLKGSYLMLECKLIKIVDGFGRHSLIIGEVIGAFIDRSYHKVSDIDEQDLFSKAPLLSYLAYGRFAVIKDSFSFPFPKHFKS